MNPWRQAAVNLGARATLVAAGASCAAAAFAAPGDHIRAGAAVITPSLDVGLEYATNPLQVQADAVGGADFLLSPKVEVLVDTSELAVRVGGEYQLRKYFSQALTRMDRFSDFSVDAAVEVLRDQPLGLTFSDTAGFRNNASGDDGGSYQSQFNNRFDGAATAHLGPTLALSVGGFYQLDNYFIPGANRQIAYNYRDAYGPSWAVDWKFFPRTAVVVEGEYRINNWGSNLLSTRNPDQPLGGVLVIPDSNQITTQAGLRGRITERLTLVLMAGYGNVFYDTNIEGGPDPSLGYFQNTKGFNRLLVTSQLGYEFGVGQKVSVGFRKTFLDTWFTNFVAYNEITGNFDGRIGSRFGVNARVSMRYEDYYGQVTRNDIRLRAQGDLTYFMEDYASLTAGVSWLQRASFQDDAVEYDDLNVHLLATFEY